MHEKIALFPLSRPLLPHGKIDLQIFEPRYLDMVRTCLREQKQFGVVAIRKGSEVAQPDAPAPELYDIGSCASIVDWQSLPNSRLGITIEGGQKFRIHSTEMQKDYLLVAAIERLEPQSDCPMAVQHESLGQLLRKLLQHPALQQQNYAPDFESTASVVNILGQVLPMPAVEQQALLEADSIDHGLQLLMQIVSQRGAGQH